jgi:hypothetical protein
MLAIGYATQSNTRNAFRLVSGFRAQTSNATRWRKTNAGLRQCLEHDQPSKGTRRLRLRGTPGAHLGPLPPLGQDAKRACTHDVYLAEV